MVHDARIVRMGGTSTCRRESAVDGRFDRPLGRRHAGGRDHQLPPAAELSAAPSDNLKVIERFTRVDADTIHYRFTVEDPTTLTAPWSGEVPFRRTDELIYEYACHEGNYALSQHPERRARPGARAETKKPQ